MSREAKLSLLVALAFLLVIGILLSDHVTSSTREPPAPLAVAAETVRGSIRAPGDVPPPTLPPARPPVASQEAAPPPAAAAQVFVFDPSSRGHGGGDVHVEVGAPSALPPQGMAADPFADAPPATPGPQTPVGPAAPAETLVRLAEMMGEPLVPADTAPRTPPTASVPPAAGVTEYVVQSGDSLSRITARVFGRDTPSNRERLLDLNPQLRANPDLIVVGQVYQIPADPQAATPAVVPVPTPAPAAVPGNRTYTVKAGDNLWSIARRTLGDASRRDEILALNRDVLPDPDLLRVGTDLRLPPG